ncbi:protein mono-ADP-ribosyltransferase PARP9 [Acomys russatus]|uniref:protein mono-ADP-ribosyltransferase PARP9 n=1 Tax=Acomys russatus TaxID=60746 RepID=UPI0021E26038|nr:protein mono-ADP-ribosyltransferase PARP9 [Acomys russatus]
MASHMGVGAAASTERPGMITSFLLSLKKGFAQLFPQCRRGHTEGDYLPSRGSDSLEEHNRWQIPVKHDVFKILKSNESQLCEVLRNKFGCACTLSCPTLPGNSSPAQPVFRGRLTAGLELSVWKDDLTRHAVDAVVNAANEDLMHGGGLAGSLVKAGGLEIQTESDRWVATWGKVPTGKIAVTTAGRLPCSLIIHAVGPQWTGMSSQSKAIELLHRAIVNILDYVTIKHTHIKTVAIPALSSGIFRFPLDLCTGTILETIYFYIQGKQTVGALKEIHLVSNEDPTVASFKRAAEGILSVMGAWNGPETTPSSAVTFQIGQGLTLQIVQGHIELQTTDVIVNSVYKYNLKEGPVSESILKQAGTEMERELDKINLSSNYQVVHVTKGFKLSCQYVYHVAWQLDNKCQVLKDAVKSCLEKCLKPDINSISFPALGTGMIGLDRHIAAWIMFDEVLAFAKEHRGKTLTVKIVIFPADVETHRVFCAELTKRFSELNLSSNSAVSVPQWSRGEQRSGLEAGSAAINLMGVKVGEMWEAKEWMERLLTSKDHHTIANSHILYLGKKEHDLLAQLQAASSVSILETVWPDKATLEIKGAQAGVIEAAMNIECVLWEVQEEVARKKEKSLRSSSGQWADQQGILDETEEFDDTFQRYPVPLTPELQDRRKQFEKCGLWVVKVEQIDNRALLAAFQEKKKMMEERSLKGSGSLRLFQQVPHQFCNTVCRVGFHRLYSTHCDPVFGSGIYFTKSLRRLADKVKKASSTDRLIYVFEADVLTGSYCQGSYSNITPPPSSPGALDTHDSVVDSISNPETVVVFSDMQAMPQYLWTCTQDRTLSQHQMWSQDYSPGPEVTSSLQSWGRVSSGPEVISSLHSWGRVSNGSPV